MKTLVITGGIGSGKSEVCRILERYGVVARYDADARVKALYSAHPTLLDDIEKALECRLRNDEGRFVPSLLSARIFSDREALEKVEALVFPALLDDYETFTCGRGADEIVVFESATILEKPCFDGFGDYVILVDAPFEVRLERACRRDGAGREAVLARMSNQKLMNALSEGKTDPRIDAVILNDCDVETLEKRTIETMSVLFGDWRNDNNLIEDKMKTDLSKILAVSGQSGLFLYISPTRTGAIVEALADKKRSAVSATSRITSLADISIYTDDEEVKLQEVFLNMKEVLGDADAPSAKSKPEELKALFEKALPTYDRDRFYVSHMKKVVEWYNALKNYASLDFVNPEDEAETEDAE